MNRCVRLTVRLGGNRAGTWCPDRPAASDAREKQGSYRRAWLKTRLGICKRADGDYVQTESDDHVDEAYVDMPPR
jgi:hypothetical protein